MLPQTQPAINRTCFGQGRWTGKKLSLISNYNATVGAFLTFHICTTIQMSGDVGLLYCHTTTCIGSLFNRLKWYVCLSSLSVYPSWCYIRLLYFLSMTWLRSMLHTLGHISLLPLEERNSFCWRPGNLQ